MTTTRTVFSVLLPFLLLGITAPCFAEQTIQATAVKAPPLIDGIDTDPAWRNAPVLKTHDKSNDPPIEIKAVYTETEIFFLVGFPDADESRTHKSWTWNSGREIYTVGHDREDVFIFKWNMEQKPVDLSLRSDDPYRADIWYWKACRTDGAGFGDDKFHILSSTEDRDATAVVSGSGKTMYLMRIGDKGESAYKINLISGYQGDILPRYSLQQPTESRGDVRARSAWKNGRWTIEFGRKLITGNEDDVQFVPSQRYLFGISRYEIAGRKPNAKLSDPLYGAGDINETLWLEFRQ